MTEFPVVEINVDEAGKGFVHINGRSIPVTDLEVKAGKDRLTEVTMTFYAKIRSI